MGLFKKKEEATRRFKNTLTYGEDPKYYYEESKRIEQEVHVMWERLRASDEYKYKEQLDEERRGNVKKYEELIGRKFGIDIKYPKWLHIKDVGLNNKDICDKSPFGYHTVLRDHNDEFDTTHGCLFCGEEL